MGLERRPQKKKELSIPIRRKTFETSIAGRYTVILLMLLRKNSITARLNFSQCRSKIKVFRSCTQPKEHTNYTTNRKTPSVLSQLSTNTPCQFTPGHGHVFRFERPSRAAGVFCSSRAPGRCRVITPALKHARCPIQFFMTVVCTGPGVSFFVGPASHECTRYHPPRRASQGWDSAAREPSARASVS